MTNISISNLKANPSKAISQASDFPVAIKKRNKVEAYLLGRELYEKIVSYIEDYIDSSAVGKIDFTKGRDFEKVAEELGI